VELVYDVRRGLSARRGRGQEVVARALVHRVGVVPGKAAGDAEGAAVRTDRRPVRVAWSVVGGEADEREDKGRGALGVRGVCPSAAPGGVEPDLLPDVDEDSAKVGFGSGGRDVEGEAEAAT
jgi:hypothetical protein